MPRGRAKSAEPASAQTPLKSERTCWISSISALLQPTGSANMVVPQACGGDKRKQEKVLPSKLHTVLSGVRFAPWPAILIFKIPLLVI